MLGSWALTPAHHGPLEREARGSQGAVLRALGDRQGQSGPGSLCQRWPGLFLLYSPLAPSQSWGLGKPRWGGEAWASMTETPLYLAPCFS